MTKITISISLDIDNKKIKTLTHKKNVNLKDIINLLLEETNHNNQIITLGSIFDKYVIEKNLKDSSVLTYKYLLCSIFGVHCFNEPIKNLCTSEKITEISTKIFNNFTFSIVYSIFNFAYQKQLITENPFLYKHKFLIQKKIYNHKKALNCENWLCLSEAESSITNFLTKLLLFNSVRYSKLNQHLILLSIILATRVSETFQIINIFNNTNEKEHYIFIDNKNTKKGAELTYRVPLTDLAIYIIKKIHRLGFKERSFIYRKDNLHTYFRTFLKQNYNNEISIHGFRSIYRTVIELLPETQNIPNWIKELSLSHETRGTVERIYQRNDAFKLRYFLQLEYSKFIFKILKNPIYLKIINNDKFLDNLK